LRRRASCHVAPAAPTRQQPPRRFPPAPFATKAAGDEAKIATESARCARQNLQPITARRPCELFCWPAPPSLPLPTTAACRACGVQSSDPRVVGHSPLRSQCSLPRDDACSRCVRLRCCSTLRSRVAARGCAAVSLLLRKDAVAVSAASRSQSRNALKRGCRRCSAAADAAEAAPTGLHLPPPPARIGMRGTYFHHPTHPVTRRRLPHACAAALRPTAPLHRPPLHASMSSCCIFPHPYRYSRFGLCKSRRSHSRGFVQVASKSQSRICTSRVEITVDDLYKQSRTHSRCFASPSRQRCAAPLHKVERSAARKRQCKPPGAGVRSSPGSSEHSIEVRITHVMYTTTYVEAITARIAPSRP